VANRCINVGLFIKCLSKIVTIHDGRVADREMVTSIVLVKYWQRCMYRERKCLDHSKVVVLLVMDHKLRNCSLTLNDFANC